MKVLVMITVEHGGFCCWTALSQSGGGWFWSIEYIIRFELWIGIHGWTRIGWEPTCWSKEAPFWDCAYSSVSVRFIWIKCFIVDYTTCLTDWNCKHEMNNYVVRFGFFNWVMWVFELWVCSFVIKKWSDTVVEI